MAHNSAKRVLGRVVFALYLLIGGISAWPHVSALGQKRLAERWNPTRVPSGTEFVGDQVCATCHKNLAAAQLKTSMGMAMEAVAESAILSANPRLSFRSGRYSYEITRRDKESFFTVTAGTETLSLPIRYAFGQGKAGQTYLLEYDGAFYEGRVSFYRAINGLDLTIGASSTPPRSLKEALGRRLSKDDTLKCFACHSTGAINGNQLQLDKLTLGIRCEACHGPGGEHVAASRADQPSAKLIFNPARLGGDELTQDYCAACHRGSEELSLLRSQGINNVRLQPYRIFNSKCYSDDRRISCTACHNPHEPLQQDAAYYDAKCLACHSARGKTARSQAEPVVARCRVGTKNCASCHMPKIEPPGAHFKFTDHRIRIARPNEAFPD